MSTPEKLEKTFWMYSYSLIALKVYSHGIIANFESKSFP